MKKFLLILCVVCLILQPLTATASSAGKQEENPDLEAAGYMGDVDRSGKVNSADARLLLQIAVEIREADAFVQFAGDMDGDGKLNSRDARIVLQTAVEQTEPRAFHAVNAYSSTVLLELPSVSPSASLYVRSRQELEEYRRQWGNPTQLEEEWKLFDDDFFASQGLLVQWSRTFAPVASQQLLVNETQLLGVTEQLADGVGPVAALTTYVVPQALMTEERTVGSDTEIRLPSSGGTDFAVSSYYVDDMSVWETGPRVYTLDTPADLYSLQETLTPAAEEEAGLQEFLSMHGADFFADRKLVCVLMNAGSMQQEYELLSIGAAGQENCVEIGTYRISPDDVEDAVGFQVLICLDLPKQMQGGQEITEVRVRNTTNEHWPEFVCSRYLHTGAASGGAALPLYDRITSREQLERYMARMTGTNDGWESFFADCDEAFFESKALLLYHMELPEGGANVQQIYAGQLCLTAVFPASEETEKQWQTIRVTVDREVAEGRAVGAPYILHPEVF